MSEFIFIQKQRKHIAKSKERLLWLNTPSQTYSVYHILACYFVLLLSNLFEASYYNFINNLACTLGCFWAVHWCIAKSRQALS